MTVTVRTPVLRVSIDGREVTSRYSAVARMDLSQRVASADIAVPTVPAWARCYDPTTGAGSLVDIRMGPTEATAYRRFLGYLTGLDFSLYPRQVMLVCMGLLGRAREYEQPDPDGVDLAGDLGATYTQMWTALLDAAGLTQAYLNGIGSSRAFVNAPATVVGLQVTNTDADGNLTGPFAWGQGESALGKGEEIDSAFYPLRCYEAGGEIFLAPIHLDHVSPTHTFIEGVNIFSANSREVWLERRNQVVVTGYDDGLGLGPVTFAYPEVAPTPRRAYNLSSPMIEHETIADAVAAGDGLSAEALAIALYPDRYRALVKVENLETPSGAVIWPGQPATVQGAGSVADRLGVNQIAWIQAVECEYSERGEWTQRLTMLGGKTGTYPVNDPPLAGFSMVLEVEMIISGGAETTLYTVHCRDTSVPIGGTISTRAWTATGGTPSSGSGEIFTTTYTDISAKSISLTVTDSKGETATVSKAVPAATSILWTRRPLYTAETGEGGCYSGAAWAVDAMNAGVTVVSNGPVWASGDRVYYSTNYLATSAYSVPKAGTNVTALYVETDISSQKILAGLADGSVYKSLDGGATWVSLGTPQASAILKVIINRYATGQYFALTATRYWDTVDEGESWSELHATPALHTFYDVAHSWDRGYLIVGDDGAGNPYAVDSGGTAQTFTGATAGCYAVAARILGGYAVILSDGTTWLSASGDDEFAPATDLPAGCTELARSLWRDGAIADPGGDGVRRRRSGGHARFGSPGPGAEQRPGRAEWLLPE